MNLHTFLSAGPDEPEPVWPPTGGLLLLCGERLPRALITTSLVRLLMWNVALYRLDGANAFDAYGLTRQVARRGADPRLVLARVHVSRAFTCYQLVERLAALAPLPSHMEHYVLYVLGLLDTFYDENVPLPEAERLLDQALAELRRLRTQGALIVLACKLPPYEAADRAVLVERVQAQADSSMRIDAAG